jgi:hypothetical protein
MIFKQFIKLYLHDVAQNMLCEEYGYSGVYSRNMLYLMNREYIDNAR